MKQTASSWHNPQTPLTGSSFRCLAFKVRCNDVLFLCIWSVLVLALAPNFRPGHLQCSTVNLVPGANTRRKTLCLCYPHACKMLRKLFSQIELEFSHILTHKWHWLSLKLHSGMQCCMKSVYNRKEAQARRRQRKLNWGGPGHFSAQYALTVADTERHQVLLNNPPMTVHMYR